MVDNLELPLFVLYEGQNTKIGAKSFNCDNGCWGSDAMITVAF